MGVKPRAKVRAEGDDPHPVCALGAQPDLPISRGGEGERYFFRAASTLIGPPPEVAR
jgi:hypothetical protein